MKLLAFFDSMAGRIFLILLVGITMSAIVGVTIAEHRRIEDLRRIQDVRTAERVGDFLRGLDRAEPAARARMAREGIAFLRHSSQAVAGTPDREMAEALSSRLPSIITVKVDNIPVVTCGPPTAEGRAETELDRVWRMTVEPTDCWLMTVRLSDGSTWRFITGPPPLLLRSRNLLDPIFLLALAVAAAALALIVARMAARPIRALADAAAQLGPDLDAAQLPSRGPGDVRVAIGAFNAMQQRLRQHLHEQTHMIFAVTHDLQTPMTRLRLRLDQVDDDDLHERLLADWRAMREIVDQGIELARSTGAQEDVVQLDVDSMIESIVEDAREMGHEASFDHAAGIDVRCRPQMLRRCVQNLVDNAILYGGSAHLSTIAAREGLVIEIRDHGPGIPPDQLEKVFEPMVRLEGSRSRETGGTGLGLTIARILARRNGAEVHLRNAPKEGLIATVAFGST